ncbi:MAG: hypothetical protein H0T62_03670 [Parachlamydiaceae bacterium]|nr:hypothetical protein [Parachlamydiaceae bacterium]
MNGDYFKGVTKYHNISDFSLCAEPLTNKTANWYYEAVDNWNIRNEDGSQSFKSMSKALGYELLARVGNVFLFPAALLDSIFHVAVGAFTLLAAIPEKIYLKVHKSKSEEGLKAEAENIEVKDVARKYTFAGACSNFESAIKYVGVAIFGTIAGVLFDPQAAADMARAGHKQIIASLIEELNELNAEKVAAEERAEQGNENQGLDPVREGFVARSVLENAEARILGLEDQILTSEKVIGDLTQLRENATSLENEKISHLAEQIQNLTIKNDFLKKELNEAKDHSYVGGAEFFTDGAEFKEEKEANFADQSQTQTNLSPRLYTNNNNNSPRNRDLHDEDVSSPVIHTTKQLTVTIETEEKEEPSVENQILRTEEKNEEKVKKLTILESQHLTLEDEITEKKVKLTVEESISALNADDEIVSLASSEEKK